jgi:CheY-like chemotaxis protein
VDKPARILVVEDEPNGQFVFRTALETAGYTVFETGDGQAALATLRIDGADLVLLDVRMPGLDEMEVLGRLRNDLREGRATPQGLTYRTVRELNLLASAHSWGGQGGAGRSSGGSSCPRSRGLFDEQQGTHFDRR